MKYYVAYGSNLNIRQMLRRCPGAKLVRDWVLINYELQFRGSKTGAYLTVVKKKNGTVPVAVWKITEEDEKRLDRYEGFPNFYYKKTLPWKNRVSADEEPISIQAILSFYFSLIEKENKKQLADRIRSKTKKYFDYDVSFDPVLKYVTEIK